MYGESELYVLSGIIFTSLFYVHQMIILKLARFPISDGMVPVILLPTLKMNTNQGEIK